MKVLITGITGFVGGHLVDYLIKNHSEVEIFGIRRLHNLPNNLEDKQQKIKFFDCDIKDTHNVNKIINIIMPDKIFHLAAQSVVTTSWDAPIETMAINIIGQCNIFEAIRKIKSEKYNPVIQIAGSSEEYGLIKLDEIPVKETNPLRPHSPYAVSKITQDFMGYQYYKSYGLNIIRTRAFNHTGPRRSEVYVDSNFAKQIAQIEKNKKNPIIEVGNLEAIRDFTDVRDIVKAYWLATEKCKFGEIYNICSEKGYKIKDILDKLISFSKVKNIKIKKDLKRMRPSDSPIVIGNCTKFKNLTKWKPQISYIEKTLLDTLNYWRDKI